MRKGDIVQIYGDPITKQKPEGQAKLIKHIYYGENNLAKIERWKVKFLHDGYETERNLTKQEG